MNILGIDTTTKYLCLGIYAKDKLYEYNLEIGRKLSCLLGVTIARVLDALDLGIEDIDYFACGLGPGSFTGMRVGLATVKGLAFSLNKPIAGISTLDILAKNVLQDNGYTVVMLDAKRSLVYYSVYRIRNKNLKRISPYTLANMDELLKKLKNLLPKASGREQVFFLGDALNLYKEDILESTEGALILDKDYWSLQPHNLISLALERIEAKKLTDAFCLEPIYLYPKECQIRKA